MSFVSILVKALLFYFVGVFLYASVRQAAVTVKPDLLPDVNGPASTPDGILKECETNKFVHIRTEHNIQDFDRVMAIMKEESSPVLFKNFMKTEFLMDTLVKNDKLLTFTDMKIESFGNTFYRGVRPIGNRMATISEVLSNMTTDADDSSGDNSLFASFVPFLDNEIMNAMLPGVPFDIFGVDSNFISNFKKDVLSTQFHSAACTSFSFQVLGTKLWVFASPSDMETFNPISLPVTIPVGQTEAGYFSRKTSIPIALVEKGDLMVFPPYWGHSVISKVSACILCRLDINRQAENLLTTERTQPDVQLASHFYTERFQGSADAHLAHASR